MPKTKKPEIIGYCQVDHKGRILIPERFRKKKNKGYLLARYRKIFILIDPEIIVVNNGGD